MSEPEAPALSDVEFIKAALDNIHHEVAQLHSRQDAIVNAVNGTGENVAWLVNSLQGIFQMLNNPAFMSGMMSQMSNGLMNGAVDAGTPAAG